MYRRRGRGRDVTRPTATVTAVEMIEVGRGIVRGRDISMVLVLGIKKETQVEIGIERSTGICIDVSAKRGSITTATLHLQVIT